MLKNEKSGLGHECSEGWLNPDELKVIIPTQCFWILLPGPISHRRTLSSHEPHDDGHLPPKIRHIQRDGHADRASTRPESSGSYLLRTPSPHRSPSSSPIDHPTPSSRGLLYEPAPKAEQIWYITKQRGFSPTDQDIGKWAYSTPSYTNHQTL